MGAKVTVLDLGLGNLHSVLRAFERVGAKAERVRSAEEVLAAERLVVPGQGAFADGAAALSGQLGDAVRQSIRSGVPYFGICLGMQLLFEESEEAPGAKGLGILEGKVLRLPEVVGADGRPAKIPQMGWNQVQGTQAHPMLRDGGWYYFVHSYYCAPKDASTIAGETVFGGEGGHRFCSAVARPGLFACQYHPEKSQRRGEEALGAFLEMKK